MTNPERLLLALDEELDHPVALEKKIKKIEKDRIYQIVD